MSILESGDTIVRAFFEAGAWALISIAILLWIVLRRFGDVLLTIVPLLLAGVVTLELCVVIGMPLNFANIIALPLLLGIGVAFKIYYIMAWRAGQTGLLQSSLTRAVFYSALTTATAFGSLWLSSHPGTSSMGKLLALSLLTHARRRRAVPAGADGQAARAGRDVGRFRREVCAASSMQMAVSYGPKSRSCNLQAPRQIPLSVRCSRLLRANLLRSGMGCVRSNSRTAVNAITARQARQDHESEPLNLCHCANLRNVRWDSI